MPGSRWNADRSQWLWKEKDVKKKLQTHKWSSQALNSSLHWKSSNWTTLVRGKERRWKGLCTLHVRCRPLLVCIVKLLVSGLCDLIDTCRERWHSLACTFMACSFQIVYVYRPITLLSTHITHKVQYYFMAITNRKTLTLPSEEEYSH